MLWRAHLAMEGMVELGATPDVAAAVEGSELDEETGKALVRDYEAAQPQTDR